MKSFSPKVKVKHLWGSVDHQQILKAMALSAVDSALTTAKPVVQPHKKGSPKDALSEAAHLGKRVTGPLHKASKPGAVAAGALAGVAGLTAVSAAVSSARKRGGS